MSILVKDKNVIVPQEIEIPLDSNIDFGTFSRTLDDMSASYKTFWLIAILDELIAGNTKIYFKKLISRMIVKAWYPILAYKLYFGACDNLYKIVNYIKENYNFKNDCKQDQLIDFLMNTDDKEIIRRMKDLTNNVPYKFLTPFLGVHSNKEIINSSKLDEKCIYLINVDDKNEKYIIVRDKWTGFLQKNYSVIKGWTYYKLIEFLQKRNPNVPAICSKLEPPYSRALKQQKDIWKDIIKEKQIIDIYTGLEFNSDNYKNKGVLSLDHFIPWSFVLHDQMWNLIPTFKNVNSKKSDNLLKYENYIDEFCNLQHKAFEYVVTHKKNHQLEEYTDVLKIDDPNKYLNNNCHEEFSKRIKQTIYPIYNIAENQGFKVINKLEGV